MVDMVDITRRGFLAFLGKTSAVVAVAPLMVSGLLKAEPRRMTPRARLLHREVVPPGPSYEFTNDSDMGFYRPDADTLTLTACGVEVPVMRLPV